MALIVGAIVNMTSTLPAEADHDNPTLSALALGTASGEAATGDVSLMTVTPNYTSSTYPRVENACGHDDYSCTMYFGVDVETVYLKVTVGDPTSADGADDQTAPGPSDYVAKIAGSEVLAAGTPLSLAYGRNNLSVVVQNKDTPGISKTYSVTVYRELDRTPRFNPSSKGVAYPAVNDRFIYGYAKDLMEHISGTPRTGSTSRYNHPNDAQVYTSDSSATWYGRDNANQRFIPGNDSDFANPSSSIPFTQILTAGELNTTGDGEVSKKDTSTFNLSEGIVIVASHNLGSIILPSASGGNGDLNYSLKQVGANGNEVNSVPDGLTASYWDDVDNQDGTADTGEGVLDADNELTAITYDNNGNETTSDVTSGSVRKAIVLTGDSPSTDSTNTADRSVWTMVYKATDTHEDADDADSAEVVFSITIQKSPVAVPDPGDEPGPGDNELLILEVEADGNAVTNSAQTPRELQEATITPEFKSDIVSYRVSIPYETEQVTIKAQPVEETGTTVKLISRSGQPLFLSTLATPWTYTFPELREGSNAPVRIEVTPPDSSDLSPKTYSIIIGREYNTPAQFDTSDKPTTLNYYDRVMIEPAVELPGGRLGNGDPTESETAFSGEWRYDLSLKSAYDGRGSAGYPYEGNTTITDAITNGGRTQDSDWMPDPPGLTFTVTWDEDDEEAKRSMGGTPTLLGVSAVSKYSDFTMLYVAKDGDLDDTKSDNAEHEFTVRVWRNALLSKLELDTSPATTGGTGDVVYEHANASDADKKMYTTWNEDATYNYDYALSNNVSQVTVIAEAMAAAATSGGATWTVDSPKDASKGDDGLPGHQVDLVDGNNTIVVRVQNGSNTATHNLTVYRQPLGADPITVTAVDGNDTIELSPDFKVETNTYEGTVESHQSLIEIEVTPTNTAASVSLNYFDVGSDNRGEVELDTGLNRIRVDVIHGSKTSTYWLNITRKGNEVPSFGDETIADRTYQVGKKLITCKTDGTEDEFVLLPAAVKGSGNGTLTYSINGAMLPDGVNFDPLTRKLTGTPQLREAYERSYDVTYVVSDSDNDRLAADTDSIMFTMTVTNDSVDKCADAGSVTVPGNLLTGLEVFYDLPDLKKTDLEFDLGFVSTTMDYDAELPHGSTNKRVAAYVKSGASVSLNQVRITHGTHTPLKDGANVIRVSFPGLSSNNYNLTVTEASESMPSFTESVPDQTWQTGMSQSMGLPVASGGNGELTYTLADHQGLLPKGMSFDAKTRIFSGTPSLAIDSAETAIYKMTYTVTDRDGDTDTQTFNITVQTDPVDVPNTGVAPMDLNVVRSGNNATVTWNAGDAAVMQYVVAHKVTTDIPALLASLKFEIVAAGVETQMLTNLESGAYQFIVVGEDASGSLEDADGNLYDDRGTY